jgi:VWFA-related protein
LVSLWRGLTVVHDFTDDPGLLIRAAKRITAATPPPADPTEAEEQKRLETALGGLQELDQVTRPPLTAAAFRSILLHMAGIPGRKSMVWITRSVPLTFGADVFRRNETANELSAMTAMLQESNVAVYPVSPGGAGTGYSDNSTRNDRVVEGRLLPGANAGIGPTDGALGDSTNLRNVADATGGIAFYNTNDLLPAIRSVLDENELNYTLGFVPDAKSLDEKLHGLDIDLVKGKGQGAELRYRKRYLATQRNMHLSLQLPQFAMEPLNATAIALAGVAQPDPAKPGTQRVQLSVQPGDLTIKSVDGKWTGGFELGLFVEGAPITTGTVKTFNLNLADDQYRQILSNGMVMEGAIPAQAGSSIRAIVRERATGTAGSIRVTAR